MCFVHLNISHQGKTFSSRERIISYNFFTKYITGSMLGLESFGKFGKKSGPWKVLGFRQNNKK